MNPDPKNFGKINVGKMLTLKSASIIIMFKLNSMVQKIRMYV